MKRDLLLEIGVEEVPAKFMPGALAQLKELAEKLLADERLAYDSLETLGTPRRLALLVYGLAEQQGDLVEEVKGPARKAAFDQAGQPTKAAQGFARSQGVAVTELTVKQFGGGEYVFAVKKLTGHPAVELLPSFFDKIVNGLTFPKPMRWGDSEFRFARPIRWLVALFGSEVVDWGFAGLKAGNLTYGHRALCDGPVSLNKPMEYREKLRQAYVIVDQEERHKVIKEQIRAAAWAEGGQAEENADLLDEVTYLVEYPTALVGSFEEKYLALPKEVVITPMREHQRYFPVYNAKGDLLNKFVTVRNGTAEYLDIVRAGNEKVLRARLADANFYYQEDLKIPLPDLVDRLQKIVFHEKLGTVLDKVERVRQLAAFIAEKLKLSAAETADLDRAVYLAKADLVTLMVSDFPELQGVMGAEYAKKSGEKEAVAQAIFEHYLPRFAGDCLPASPIGRAAAIADKLDTIVGSFAIGIQPTGSQDPYALRRQALGICHIILDARYDLSLAALVEKAYQGFTGKVAVEVGIERVQTQLADFFAQRFNYILADQGYRYDLIEAVLAKSADNPVDAAERAKALALFREREDFVAYAQAFTRANNLAKKAVVFEPSDTLCQEPAEHALLGALRLVYQEIGEALNNKDYATALESAAKLVKPIEDFFDNLMVMVEDEKVRNNRLAMLWQSAALMSAAGDIGKLVI
ncbi:MAG TPA: glycine--tRNA ligase subunit beta [Desulfobacteria bacterium]|nr:glycine--tRNA ligase subunit beta [Desulfobacteria bacterium]